MKQRIRGLVSLHEIPFSSRALQREEGNWPHYTKREGEGGVCGDWGGRWKGGGKKSFLNTLLFFTSPVFPQCHSAWLPPPPVTSHIAIQEVFLGLPFFGKVRRWGVWHWPWNLLWSWIQDRQPGNSVREREWSQWEWGRVGRAGGGHGCHGDLLKDVSTLVYLWAGRACTAGPLTEQMCVRARLCVHVFISMWVRTLTCRQTPRPINWPFHSFLCKQTCTDKHTNTASLNRSPPYQLGIIEPTGVGW